MLSIPDMAILGTAALLFFGPEQLPKVARKVGLFMRDVQNTSNQFVREMERAADEPGSGIDLATAHETYDPQPYNGVHHHDANGTAASDAPHDEWWTRTEGHEPPAPAPEPPKYSGGYQLPP